MRALFALALTLMVGCGRIGFDSICGLVGPCVLGVEINGSAVYARAPRLGVAVEVRGTAPLEVRVAEATGDCQDAYADDRWQPYVGPEVPLRYLAEPTDGVKKLCVWARDGTGDVSVIDREALGANVDTIQYETQNLPSVESFTASIVAGQLALAWTLSDVEGLADGPVELEYTLDDVEMASWQPLATGLGGTSATGAVELAVPTAAPFFVRLVPTDRAGNRGVPAVSTALNVSSWSVYMGSRDRGLGASARAARLKSVNNLGQQFAVDPATLDVYAMDDEHGIIRVDGATGLVERMFELGAPNLPDDGPLPARPVVRSGASIEFGEDGLLYVGVPAFATETASGVLYQIDPATRHCRRYLGGGTDNTAAATAASIYMLPWTFDFDEDGSIYFFTACTPGLATSTLRMMKATRQTNGTAGTLSVIAGNCAPGSTLPDGGPYDPLTNPLQGFGTYVDIGSIAAGDHGRLIYFSSYPGVDVWKIVDGQLWSSNLSLPTFGALAYDDVSDTLYAGGEGGLHTVRPNRTGPIDTITISGASAGLGACTADGVLATDACLSVDFTLQATPDRLYFVDGSHVNQVRSYRIRFIDRGGAVRTYVGAPPFVGVGAQRTAARTDARGIVYKPATAPNQTAFPAGLYFIDQAALAFGHVAADDTVVIDWGNGANTPVTHTTGVAIGPDIGLGISYFGGTEALAFDNNGLPWLRYENDYNTGLLVSVDAARRVVQRQQGPEPWEIVGDTDDPTVTQLWPYGTVSNLVVEGEAAVLFGGYEEWSTVSTIRIFDFAAMAVTHIMGAAPNNFTADRTTPGTVSTASLSSTCTNYNTRCFAHYDPSLDRLYFSENHRLRYITTPFTPATSTLITLYTHPTQEEIDNFTLRPDGSQIYYLSDGRLRCLDITSGDPTCDGRDLGPLPLFGFVKRGPNQLTWRDNNTLLLSTYNDVVLEYAVP